MFPACRPPAPHLWIFWEIWDKEPAASLQAKNCHQIGEPMYFLIASDPKNILLGCLDEVSSATEAKILTFMHPHGLAVISLETHNP